MGRERGTGNEQSNAITPEQEEQEEQEERKKEGRRHG